MKVHRNITYRLVPGTAVRARKLASTAGDTVVWDCDLPGFGIRVYASGRKVWCVQTRGPAGRPKRVALGRYVEVTPEQARQRAALAIDRIRQGLDPDPPPPAPEPTVADLAARYLEAYVQVNCRPRTVATFETILRRHIVPELGQLRLADVDRAEVAALHHKLRATPWQANQTVRVLARMFRLAGSWRMIPPGRNPCRSVRRYREKGRERFLTPAEYRRLGRVLNAAAADGSVFPTAVPALRLLLLTGCRKQEILNLQWDDVDRAAGEVRLRDGKSGWRSVPLTPAVAHVFAGIPRVKNNPWVITGQQRGSHLKSLDDIWQRLRRRAGLEDVRIHDCRHSYASRALVLGAGWRGGGEAAAAPAS